MKKSYTVETYVGERDATVAFDFYPGKPGVYSGPPEKCYEDEPDELDVTRVLIGGECVALSDDETEELVNRLLYDTAMQLIENEALDADDYAEQTKERRA